MEPRLTEVTWKKDGKLVEGFYLGISYNGSFDSQTPTNFDNRMTTKFICVRREDGKVVELYPQQITFKYLTNAD